MAVDAQAAKSIFLAAADIAVPEERAAYLQRACGTDAALRGRVEELLNAHFRSGPFLQAALPFPGRPEVETQGEAVSPPSDYVQRYLAPATRADSLGRLAHYEVLSVLGQGGFGTV